MRFGASSWPFQWEPPYEDVIRRVAGFGFKAIELIGWNTEYLNDYWTKAKIADMKASSPDSGIGISQFVHTPHELSQPRQGEARGGGRQLEAGGRRRRRARRAAHQHGVVAPVRDARPDEIPRITTKPLVQTYATRNVPRGVDWDQNYEDYVEAVRACAEVCGKAGVKMSVEPHPGRYLANHDGALRLLEHVDHPAIGINFDPSHTFPIGDFPEHHRLSAEQAHHAHARVGQRRRHQRPLAAGHGQDRLEGDVPGAQGGRLRRRRLDRARGRAGRVARQDQCARRLPQRDRDRGVRRRDGAGMNYLKGICKEVGIKVE